MYKNGGGVANTLWRAKSKPGFRVNFQTSSVSLVLYFWPVTDLSRTGLLWTADGGSSIVFRQMASVAAALHTCAAAILSTWAARPGRGLVISMQAYVVFCWPCVVFTRFMQQFWLSWFSIFWREIQASLRKTVICFRGLSAVKGTRLT